MEWKNHVWFCYLSFHCGHAAIDAVCLSPCTGFIGDKSIRVVVTDTKNLMEVVKQKTKRRAMMQQDSPCVCVFSLCMRVYTGSFSVYPFPFFLEFYFRFVPGGGS
jgi:hypothetical protein